MSPRHSPCDRRDYCFHAYTKTAGVQINYGGGGSGKGRQDLADMVVDFAGADSPYKDADLAKNKGGDVLYFPILLGPITISYNLDGVDKLKLSPDTCSAMARSSSRTSTSPRCPRTCATRR
ncbi:MAG TPA: substrate-binding domain-containing protein [Kofleriaceae bacterium]|nr:substrate-binding domain-containing protein [Kofleriaceae bacterium]